MAPHEKTPPEIEDVGKFIADFVIQDVLRDNQPPRLSPAAPAAKPSEAKAREIAEETRVVILPGQHPDAAYLSNGVIRFTYGWLCQRWCSTFLFLESLSVAPDPNSPLIRTLEPQFLFSWPEGIPPPWSVSDPSVSHANRVFPYVVYATLLHEVYHAIDGSTSSTPAVELACDRFSMDWLHGNRADHFRDIAMVGLGIWVCCLCSETLGYPKKIHHSYPSPVDRLLQFFDVVASGTDDLSERVRAMCAAHLLKLTKEHKRPALETAVLLKQQTGWREFIMDLRRCWPWPEHSPGNSEIG